MQGFGFGFGFGLTSLQGGGGGAPGVTVVRSISRGELATTTQAPAGAGKTRFDSRISYPIKHAASRVKFVFANRYLTTSGEANGPGSITINAAAAEVGATVVAATFTGSAGITLAAGALATESDWINVPVVPGDILWARLQADAASGVPATNTTLTNDRTISYDPVNPGNTILATGALTTPTGGVNVLHFAPVLIIGEVAEGKMAIIGLGDSIGSNEDDFTTTNTWTGETGGGFMRRAAFSLGAAYTSASLSGRTLEAYSSTGLIRSLFEYHNVGFNEAGTNSLAVGQTAAQLLATSKAIWANMLTDGITYIFQSNILPRGTTTDRTTTLANQTPGAQFGLTGPRADFNTALAANVGSDGLTGMIDIAALVEEPTSRDKWALRSYSSTLTAAATSSATSISVADAAPVNEYIVGDPGGANQSTQKTRVTVGGLTPTLTSGGFGVAQLNGAVVKASPSRDMVHPSPIHHIAFASATVTALTPYVA